MSSNKFPVEAVKASSVLRPSLFNGKVALVTGGGTGIGKAICRELLYLGCSVVIASRNEKKLSTAVDHIRTIDNAHPSKLTSFPCNIREEKQVSGLISKVLGQFGRLDFLVNNGGGQFTSYAESIKLKGWNAVVETNLTGTFLCCREAFSQTMKENGGVIVNITMDTHKGTPLMSHSAAARAGVENLTKSLALEWVQHGVRINCIAPGGSIFSQTAADNYGGAEVFATQIPRVPAKRLGHTEEISGAVCFLLSPAASFITGQTLRIDGGGSLYQNFIDIPDHNGFPAYSWDEDNPTSPSKL